MENCSQLFITSEIGAWNFPMPKATSILWHSGTSCDNFYFIWNSVWNDLLYVAGCPAFNSYEQTTGIDALYSESRSSEDLKTIENSNNHKLGQIWPFLMLRNQFIGFLFKENMDFMYGFFVKLTHLQYHLFIFIIWALD